MIGQRGGVSGAEHHQTHAAKLPGPGSDSLLAIGMPLDYLNEASDEIQRLFARLDDVERTLRKAS